MQRLWTVRLQSVINFQADSDWELTFLLEEKKWNKSGFRPLLCSHRLNWARRTSWGWWDYWDDTALQTQDSKFKPWRSEAEHTTSWSRRLPTILNFTSGLGRSSFVSYKPPRPGSEPRTLAWNAAVLKPLPWGPCPPTRRRGNWACVSKASLSFFSDLKAIPNI